MTSREGFSAYAIIPPPPGALVRFWHELNGQVWTGRACDLSPYMNATYLWWKMTGIEHERLGERAA